MSEKIRRITGIFLILASLAVSMIPLLFLKGSDEKQFRSGIKAEWGITGIETERNGIIAVNDADEEELRMLPGICSQGRKVFVDTNIGIETLRKIAPINHTLVMLSDPKISIHRFFDRPDPEKQFLYQLILEEPDPEKAMENYRQGLELICSQEAYDELLNSGFNVIFRDESRTIEQTVALAEEALGL